MAEERVEVIEEGKPLDAEDVFWLKKAKELTADSIKSVEEAGKQLIAMITVMEGIYAAVLAFSGIKTIPANSLPAAVAYVSPIFLWLVSLFFAIRIFKTKEYSFHAKSPDSVKQTFLDIAKYKQENLERAYTFLCISFAVSALGILYWLYTGNVAANPGG
ncbi:MAG: hypothetical protein V3W31_02045 [Thermodesulfobacteriota bacterium]